MDAILCSILDTLVQQILGQSVFGCFLTQTINHCIQSSLRFRQLDSSTGDVLEKGDHGLP
jgi:hypothetical protein